MLGTEYQPNVKRLDLRRTYIYCLEHQKYASYTLARLNDAVWLLCKDDTDETDGWAVIAIFCSLIQVAYLVRRYTKCEKR